MNQKNITTTNKLPQSNNNNINNIDNINNIINIINTSPNFKGNAQINPEKNVVLINDLPGYGKVALAAIVFSCLSPFMWAKPIQQARQP